MYAKHHNLPSVARAALSRVTTAHPADPENPDMNSLRASHAAMYSELWLSSEGTTTESLVETAT